MTVRRNFTFYYVLAFAGLPLLSVLVPKAMAFAPVLLGLIGTLYLLRKGADKALFSRTYLFIACVIGVLACLSALWASDPGDVFEKAFTTALLLISGALPLFAAKALDREELRSVCWLIPALLFAAAILASLELGLGLPLYKVIHHVEEGQKVYTAVINRGAVNIVLSLFCSLAIIQSGCFAKPPSYKYGALAGLILMIALMLALSQAQIAQLTFIAGLIVYALYPAGRRSKMLAVLLASVTCALLLCAPWLAQWMYAYLAESTQNLDWLKNGYAASRMEIWDFTSRYALEQPLIGHGLDATKYVEAFDHAHRFHRDDGVLHPHNFAIQIWVDFGLLGVFPACALIYYLFSSLTPLKRKFGAAAMATFLMTLAVAAISYGLWQSHWIGVMIYLLALVTMVKHLLDESDAT